MVIIVVQLAITTIELPVIVCRIAVQPVQPVATMNLNSTVVVITSITVLVVITSTIS